MNPARRFPRRARAATALLLGFSVASSALVGSAFGDAGRAPDAAGSGGAVGGPNSISVVAQSPWVTSGQSFHLRLQIVASDPSTDKLSIQAFSRLTTRTDFNNARAGRVPGSVRYAQVEQLSQLQADPAGGFDVDIPVNSTQPTSPGGLPTLSAIGGSGVFPLQLSLADLNGAPLGKPLTTFLVYAAGDPSATGFPRLAVSVVLPVRSPPVIGPEGQLGPVSSAESNRLSELAATLARHADVNVDLAVNPQTLDALNSGSAVDKATLNALAGVGRSSAQVLAATYSAVSLNDLFASGLGSEFGQQVSVGQSTLGRYFGASPAPTTWVLNGPVDSATLGGLTGLGMTQVILPDGDLTGLPVSSRQTTFAFPSKLTPPDKGSSPVTIYAADPGLTGDFASPGTPVLAASRLLAELSMIQVETPGLTRGVAVLPPARWAADPAFVETLLSGLSGHPLLQASTASSLFEQVKPSQVQRSLATPSGGGPASGSSGGSGNGSNANGSASGSASGGSGVPSGASGSGGGSAGASGSPAGGGLFGQPSSSGLSNDAARIKGVRRAIDSLRQLIPPDTAPSVATLVGEIGNQLLVAESNDISEAERQSLVGAAGREATRELNAVTLPGSSSITLTSTKGQIPLTILSLGGIHARVELRLSSQRLIFRPFNPADGHCTVPTPTSEICELTLGAQNTTLKLPVETRSSGVFPVDVSLWTPGGGQRLALNRDTVRSTAVSNVGVILIVLAISSLIIWWARDLRHGRRARKLIPPPVFEEPQLSDEPSIRDFFANPPPGYPDRGDSPARPRR